VRLDVFFKKLLQRHWHQSSGVWVYVRVSVWVRILGQVLKRVRGTFFLSIADMVSVDVNLGEYSTTCSWCYSQVQVLGGCNDLF